MESDSLDRVSRILAHSSALVAESALLVERWTIEYTTTGLLRIDALNSTRPASGWPHLMFSRQLLDSVEAQL